MEWRAIPGFPGYEVSDTGLVRSPNRLLSLKPNNHGYCNVALWRDGKKVRRHVHNLVLEAFVGPRPEGQFGCHNDGVRTNNSLSNLRWDTASANQLDRHKHGTMCRGSENYKTHLTEADVLEIRRQAHAGVPFQEIADKFGLSKGSTGNIATGRSWGWFKDEIYVPSRINKPLEPDQVRDIRRRAFLGETYRSIGEDYNGLGTSAISNIVKRKTYADIY